MIVQYRRYFVKNMCSDVSYNGQLPIAMASTIVVLPELPVQVPVTRLFFHSSHDLQEPKRKHVIFASNTLFFLACQNMSFLTCYFSGNKVFFARKKNNVTCKSNTFFGGHVIGRKRETWHLISVATISVDFLKKRPSMVQHPQIT